MKQTGTISTFGGPLDTGVGVSEGLALIEKVDLGEWWFRRLFLDMQPEGTTGLARRLNPDAFYIAMRFKYPEFSRADTRRAMFRLTNPKDGHSIFAQAADWGPNERTHRIIDMSPGAARALHLSTDDIVQVEMIPATPTP